MVEGANPHAIIKQLFTNPDTKTLNRAGIVQFIKSLDKEADAGKRNFWIYVENQISRERLLAKYNNLIKKGIYVTSFQANADAKESGKKANFNFIAEKLNSISDSAVKVKESDLKKYYKTHSAEYEQEASRDLEYITYDIAPSPDDFAQAKKWIDNIKPDFETSSEIKQFVSLNSDVPFTEKYLKQSELPDTLKSIMLKAKVGTSYGPYFENSTFKIARLADVKNLPDSVRARHILLQPEGKTKEAFAKTKSTADSLLKVLKKGGKGVKFELLALQYSKDGTASKGGDLGWFKEGAMVKPFNDACFNGKKGDLVIVESQFGVHIIEITDKGKEVKKFQVGILERKVEASNITIQAIYQKASAFAGSNNTGEKFSAGLKKENMIPKVANYLNEQMKDVPGLDNSRELIRWSFGAELNALSDIKQFGSKFTIARLSKIRSKGIAPFDQVREQVLASVMKEKKSEMLAEKINKELTASGKLEDIALKLNTQVLSANDISYNSYAIPNVGFEPALIAAATSIKPNTLSSPIKGNNGVYVLYVTSVSDQEQSNPQMLKGRMAGMYANRVNYEAYNTLKKLANIKDERIKFY
jgi:peptidyl-prolyl cis-trans isomerase D